MTDEPVVPLEDRFYMPMGPSRCTDCRKEGDAGVEPPICVDHRRELSALFREKPQFWVVYDKQRQGVYRYERVNESRDAQGKPGDLDPDGHQFAKMRTPTVDFPYPLSREEFSRALRIRGKFEGAAKRHCADLDEDHHVGKD